MNLGNKLFVLDAFALIYRSYYAFIKNPRINTQGFNTSAIFGFTTTLLDVIKNHNPSHMIVAFDTPGKTKRAEMYSEYKANRQAMPEDIVNSINYIKDIIRAFNIPFSEYEGFEADDIIGTITAKAKDFNLTSYIMSFDKDLGQLVNESTFLFRPSKSGNAAEIWGVKEVCDKFEINHPKQIIDLLGLQGDQVDNIPGVPGIGEKTAKKLIRQYGTLENILSHTNDFKGKLKNNLTEYKEQAILSKQLATIEIDLPLNLNPKQCEIKDPNVYLLKSLFDKLEFRQLSKRIFTTQPTFQSKSTSCQGDLFDSAQISTENEDYKKNIPNNIATTPNHYHLVSNSEQRQTLVNELKKQDCFSFDTVTTNKDPNLAELLGISFSWKKNEAWYLEVRHVEANNIIHEISSIFQSSALKIGFNLKYDLIVINRYGVKVNGPFFDTMIAHHLLEPSMTRRNLNYLAQTYLNYNIIPIKELIGDKKQEQSSMESVPLEKIKEYTCENAHIVLQLKEVFNPKLIDSKCHKLFNEIEAPLVPVLAAMESEGIRIDHNALNDLSAQLEEDSNKVQLKIFETAGKQFNISSPKQVGEILFDHLQIVKNPKKTKSGQYATGEDILLRLKTKHPIIDLILDYRELLKLKNTYVDPLPGMENPISKRIHTSFNQLGTSTGRLSSDKPNLQNIPIRTQRGRLIRKAFIPRNDDFVLLSADYSQIELRIIATLSKDPGMIQSFQDNIDIHTATAAKIFTISIDDVTREMRSKAKAVNFGIAYGQTAFGLSQSLQIPRSEAHEIIDNFFEKFPKVKSYMETSIQTAKKRGFVETLKGRRHYLKDINSSNATVRNHAERIAINSPIQGSAAEMIKIAMIHIYEEFERRKLKSKLLLQVHDELVFDLYRKEEEDVMNLVNNYMETALPLSVPVIIEMKTGNNWLEAH